MSLAEGVSARIAYKFYATGAMTSNVQAVSSADPGASSAQILRRVASTLSLSRDTYQSNEVRTDRQIADYRLGTRRAQGNITGEFSPGTYWDFIEAACRGTEVAAVTVDQSDLTSLAADNTTSKFIAAAGDPVTLGLRVGDIIRPTGLADADNNSKNFVILSFGGTSNREITVYPAPDTMSADTSFSLTAFKSVMPPSSSHVSRKVAVEIYNQDIDMARLFTECRVGGFNVALPATGMATVEIPLMGRDMEIYEASNAPFFTSPTAETTTGIFAAVNGLLRVNTSIVGVVTGLTVNMALSPSGDAVVGQDFVPEIFLGRTTVTGQVTALLEDADMINNFLDEDEISILAYLTTTNAVNSPAATILLPRIKFTNADVQTSGEGGQSVTLPYQALLSTAAEATTGIPASTIRFVDTAA